MASAARDTNDWLLHIAKAELRDDDVEAACEKKIEAHRRRGLASSDGGLAYQEFDASQNIISWRGCRTIVDVALRCQDLRVVKLFRNELTDRAAAPLARLLEESVDIEQMHLSHNRFTREGASELIRASHRGRLARREKEHDKTRTVGLWLRLEHNLVQNAPQLLEELWQTRVDFCEARDAQRCGPRVCKRCCLVHLPYFSKQNTAQHEPTADVVDLEEDSYTEDSGSEASACSASGSKAPARQVVAETPPPKPKAAPAVAKAAAAAFAAAVSSATSSSSTAKPAPAAGKRPTAALVSAAAVKKAATVVAAYDEDDEYDWESEEEEELTQ